MNTAILRIMASAADAQVYDITLVLRDETGQEQPLATTTCPVTLQPAGMANALAADALQQRFTAAQGQEEAIRTIGVQLHTLVTGNGVGAALAALPASTSVIFDVEPPALRRLPWELLWDDSEHRALFLDEQRPICRGHLDAAIQLAEPEWPLRMLVIVGARDDDTAALPQPEVERIWRTLGGREADVDLLVRRRPRRADLVAEMRAFQPHILHFIGHGGAVDEEDEESDAYLELDSDTPGAKQAWTATEIRSDLSQARNLRLVFLNACRTSAAGMNGLWTVADAFLKCGAAAVVSTRADVKGTDASLVAATFYAALAAGKPVDAAAAVARQRIDQEYGGSFKRREWGALCLQVQTPPAAVLSLDGDVPAKQRKFVKLNLASALKKVSSYVDRVPERRASWQGVRRQDEPRLLAIVGEAKVGKTALAQLLIVRCALANWVVRYVDLGLEREQNFLRVLQLLRAGAPMGVGAESAADTLLSAALPDDVFAEFDQVLTQLAGPLAPGASPPDVVRQRGNLQKLFAAYNAGLDKAIAQSNKPHMLIVLDHLYAIPASEFRILFEHFLLGHLTDEKSKLRIVLLLRPEDRTALKLDDFDADVLEQVELSRFPLQTWDELAFQYMLRRLDETVGEESIRTLVQGSRNFLRNTSWTPDNLDRMLLFAQGLMGGG